MTSDPAPRGSTDTLGYSQRSDKNVRRSNFQLTAQDFVAAFATKNHLHTHSFDLPAKKVHRGTCSHSRHIVGLEVVDDLLDSIQTLLYSESVLMVNCAEICSSFASGEQVWRVLEADAEGMQLWPRRQRC